MVGDSLQGCKETGDETIWVLICSKSPYAWHFCVRRFNVLEMFIFATSILHR